MKPQPLLLKEKNLAVCREGEYEGLAKRMSTIGEKPDYGAREWTSRWHGQDVQL